MTPPGNQPPRAFVTGATGFIGGRLLRHLHAAGWQTAVISRAASPVPPHAIRAYPYTGHTSEVMHAVADFQPSTVFHLASLFLAQHTPEQIEPLISANVLLGTQLLEAMKSAGVTSLVTAGTAWQNFAGDAYLPVNLYAATKQAFDDILLYYGETGALRAITLKLFDSYGPGDPRRKLLHLLLECLRTGQPLAMSPGQQVLDLVHVDDLCRAFLRSAQLLRDPTQPPHAVYAISGGQRRTLREVVATLEAAAGQRLPIDWGARPYRDREVMLPWTGPHLPGWQPAISLEQGFRELLAETAADSVPRQDGG